MGSQGIRSRWCHQNGRFLVRMSQVRIEPGSPALRTDISVEVGESISCLPLAYVWQLSNSRIAGSNASFFHS